MPFPSAKTAVFGLSVNVFDVFNDLVAGSNVTLCDVHIMVVRMREERWCETADQSLETLLRGLC